MTSAIPSKHNDGLVLRKSTNLDDWYLIERANHDGREWEEPTEYGSALRCSSRISDADVEGSAAEMLALAVAIEGRSEEGFKRCAVRIVGEKAHFWSPRNSRVHGVVSLAAADALAASIRTALEPSPDRAGMLGGSP